MFTRSILCTVKKKIERYFTILFQLFNKGLTYFLYIYIYLICDFEKENTKREQ